MAKSLGIPGIHARLVSDGSCVYYVQIDGTRLITQGTIAQLIRTAARNHAYRARRENRT